MKCRLCGNSDLYYYYSQGNKGEYKFYKCPNCGLVNYNLETGLDQTKYGGTYIDPAIENHKQNVTQRATYDFIAENIKEPGSALDIGCGNGKLLLLLREAGWEVTGLELLESYAEEIKKRFSIDVKVANFLEYEGFDKKFDLVMLKHVLEHLPDSLLAMRKINNLLKPGGYGLLEFPNIESMQFKAKRFLSKIGLYNKKYRTGYVPGHCNEFSKKSFEYLLKETGFELVKWELYSNKSGTTKFYTVFNIGSKARALIKKIDASG